MFKLYARRSFFVNTIFGKVLLTNFIVDSIIALQSEFVRFYGKKGSQ